MSTSKLQRATSQYLSRHFGKYTIRENIRPEWLLDATGRRLELDFYIEEIRVAVEVQGDQHYKYTEQFHVNYDGFLDQIERDRLKKEACENSDIVLVEVSSESDLPNLLESLPNHPEKSSYILPPKRKKYNPYTGIDKSHAIMSAKMRVKEISRLEKLNPVPHQSIKNVRKMMKEIIDRYCLTSQDYS